MDPTDSVGARFGLIVEESQRLALAALPMVIGFVAAMTAAGVVVDIGLVGGGSDLLVNVLSIALAYFLTIELIKRGGLAPDGLGNGFGSYFGLSILINIATIIGLIFLIVPGVVLIVRWSGAYGYSLADGVSVNEAMGQSWEATADHFWPILIALLLPFAGYAAGLLMFVYGADDFGVMSAPASTFANAALFAATAGYTIIGLAVYSLLGQPDTGIAEVFD